MPRTSSIKKKSKQQPQPDLKLFQAQLAVYGMRINEAGVMVPIKRKTTKVANPPVMNDVQLDSNNDNHSDSDSNNDVEDNGDEDEDEDDRDEDRDGDGSDEGDDNEDDGEGDAVVHISVGKDGRKRTRKKIRLAWCEKSDGSPGRRKSGYPLRETLKMTNGGYRIVYGGVKVLLMRTKGIDMTRTITKQPKELINHVVRKALSLYPEFEMFCRGALWPLKAFAHVILRTSSDQYRKRLSDGSGTKATKAKKVAKTSNTKKKKPIEDMEVENHPAVEDSSLGEVERSLAVKPPVKEELPFDEPPFEGGPASDGVNNAEPPEADDVDDMDMVAHNLSRATLDETMNSVQGDDDGGTFDMTQTSAHTLTPAPSRSFIKPPPAVPAFSSRMSTPALGRVYAPPPQGASASSRSSAPPPLVASPTSVCLPAPAPVGTPVPPPLTGPALSRKLAPPPSATSAASASSSAPAPARAQLVARPLPAASTLSRTSGPSAPKPVSPPAPPAAPASVSTPTAKSADTAADTDFLTPEVLAHLQRIADRPDSYRNVPLALQEAFKKLFPNPNNPAVDHNSTTVPDPAPAPIVIPPAPSSAPKSRRKPKMKAPIQPEPEPITGYESSASDALSASESNPPVDTEAQDQAANEVKTSNQSAAKKGKSNANGNAKEAGKGGSKGGGKVGANGKAGGGSGEKASGGASKGGGKGSANGGPSAGRNEGADAGAGGSGGKGKGKAKAQAVPAKEAVPNPGIRRSTREVPKKVGR